MGYHRKIIYYPDPRLLKPCEAIESITPELRALIDEMFTVMYEANGVGLAAPQIGISKQLAVIDVSESKNEQLCIINPSIIETRGVIRMMEGCLSVPGTYEEVERPEWIKVKAMDQFGKIIEIEAEGVLAECLQHEIEHLAGKLYLDKLSQLKRKRVIEKMKKFQRQHHKR